MGLFDSLLGHSSSPKPPPILTPPSSSPQTPPILPSHSSSQEAQRLYEEGERLMMAGESQEGMRRFAKAIEIDPRCVDACVALAKGFFFADSEKYSEQILKLAEQAFRAAPSNPQARNIASVAYFTKGKLALRREDWGDATDQFKKAYELDPDHKQTLELFRISAGRAGKSHTFAEVCEARLKAQPDDHRVRCSLGSIYIKMAGKGSSSPDQSKEYLRRAEENLNAFLTTDPMSADGNLGLGTVYALTGRFMDASEIVDKLRDIDSDKSNELDEILRPVNPPVSATDSAEARRLYEEGVRKMQDGDREGLELILEATDIDPNCVDALAALANALFRMDAAKNSDNFFSLADQAYRADPNNPKARRIASNAYLMKGQMALEAEDWQKAVRSFKRSFELAPNHENLSAFRYCAEKAHEIGVFVDACETRLKEQPEDNEVRYKLGRALVVMACEIMSDPEKESTKIAFLRRAEGHLNVFLPSNPNHAYANYFLGIVFLMTFRLDEAAQIVAKLSSIDLEMSKDLENILTGKTLQPLDSIRETEEYETDL